MLRFYVNAEYDADLAADGCKPWTVMDRCNGFADGEVALYYFDTEVEALRMAHECNESEADHDHS